METTSIKVTKHTLKWIHRYKGYLTRITGKPCSINFAVYMALSQADWDAAKHQGITNKTFIEYVKQQNLNMNNTKGQDENALIEELKAFGLIKN